MGLVPSLGNDILILCVAFLFKQTIFNSVFKSRRKINIGILQMVFQGLPKPRIWLSRSQNHSKRKKPNIELGSEPPLNHLEIQKFESFQEQQIRHRAPKARLECPSSTAGGPSEPIGGERYNLLGNRHLLLALLAVIAWTFFHQISSFSCFFLN